MKLKRRQTVGSRIYAIETYPKYGSAKSSSAEHVNVVLSDDEALNLARHLIQAAREAVEITAMFARIPAKKSGLHTVTVTYEVRKRKEREQGS